MHKPILLDTTLRDGEQSPGIYFTRDEKIQIARELDQIGIEIIEAGIPSMGEEEQKSISALKKLNLKADILSWNRLLVEDVQASFKAGIYSVHISVPTSDLMLGKKMGKDREWILPQMEKVILFAKKEGATISFGAEDASRTDPAILRKVFVAAQDLGVNRVRFADTLGIMTPSQVADSIGYLVKGLQIPLDFHGHNDFGLATANTLTAWENGAGVASCSLLGLGERAGNTSLEEFAGVMHYLKGIIYDFDFVRLYNLCKTISEWIKTPIPDNKPIIGDKIYTHESGIHVDGLLKEASTYESFPPEQTGGVRRLVLGKHSGKKAVRYLAKEKGYEITDEQIETFLSSLRKQMAEIRGVDSAALFQDFLKKNVGRAEV